MKPQDIQRVIDEHLSGYDPVPRQMDAVRARIRHAQRRRMPVRVAFIVAIILILAALAAIGVASRGEEPIQYFMKYDYDRKDGCVKITYDKDNPTVFRTDEDFTPEERAIWGDELCDKIREKNLRYHLPTWLPDGIQLDTQEYNDYDDIFFSSAVACDENNDKYVILRIQGNYGEMNFIAGESSFETDGEVVELVQCNGRPVLFVSNLGNMLSVWQEGNSILYITTQYPMETLKKIMDSIPQ